MPTVDELEDMDDLDLVPGQPESRDLAFECEAIDPEGTALRAGLRLCREMTDEGFGCLAIGDGCFVGAVVGGQYLHSDRHTATDDPMITGHCWNAVLEADGDQMLLVKETGLNYRHHRMGVGSLIYFNALQPHLVSRGDPGDRCVLVQVLGLGPDEPERAIEIMIAAVARLTGDRRSREEAPRLAA